MRNRSYNKVKLSVVIITLNEERNIERCLRSVQPVADEIVVLDSGSSDNTRFICEKYHVKYYVQRFIRYDWQKNSAVHMATFDHILSLDADEALTAKLTESIAQVKNNWQHNGYYFNRITCFCGKWIRHGGWYPNRVTRLFNRRKASWSGRVHERLKFNGFRDAGYLKGDLLHYSFYSLSHYHQKIERYTDIAAKDLFEKRNIRPGVYHFYVKPLYRFCYSFFIRGGFLDGYTGFHIARLTAAKLFLKFTKLKAMQQESSYVAGEQSFVHD